MLLLRQPHVCGVLRRCLLRKLRLHAPPLVNEVIQVLRPVHLVLEPLLDLLLLFHHVVVDRVYDCFWEIVQLLVLPGNYLGLVLQLVPELLMDGVGQLVLVRAHVLLEEADVLHGTVQAVDHGVALLEDLRVRDTLDVVVDGATTKFERLDLQVLILDDFDQLVDLVLVRFRPQLQLLLAELKHVGAEIVNALVEIAERADDARA